MDMRTFFGESPLRLVAYEITDKTAKECPNIHPLHALNYAFNIMFVGIRYMYEGAVGNGIGFGTIHGYSNYLVVLFINGNHRLLTLYSRSVGAERKVRVRTIKERPATIEFYGADHVIK